ncbi:hypothetical protein CEV34_0072 [Brucella pseudogrignonensis]|uniref:Uncharacterized protein n=1 Tax=Brucella pseudogrignonensis TaxID=419475 RepID=A0A256GUM8_9HYPH|nr:hypothetical protein CEV34_0072 [Brucella pseudogrignonensis]
MGSSAASRWRLARGGRKAGGRRNPDETGSEMNITRNAPVDTTAGKRKAFHNLRVLFSHGRPTLPNGCKSNAMTDHLLSVQPLA